MKKLLSLLVGFILAMSAHAVDFEYTYEGQTLTYTIISETEKTCKTKDGMGDYAPGNDIFGDLKIPAFAIYNGEEYTVTSIGSNAFNGCSGLTSVEIPNSVTSIGADAFIASSLTELIIADGTEVLNVGTMAFDYTPIKTLYLGRNLSGSLWNISGNPYFNSCLSDLTIGNTVTSIGNDAFNSRTGLTSVVIPNTVTSIGDNAFSDCTGLTDLTIADATEVLEFGGRVFDNTSLKTVYLGRTFTCSYSEYSDYPFYNSSLSDLTIGNSVTSIGENALWGCGALTSVEIPNSVTSIGDYAFYNCTGLTVLEMPNSVTLIGDEAFSNCKLSKITLPESITSIGERAFNDNLIEELTIPSNLSTIGDQAFYGCPVSLLSINGNLGGSVNNWVSTNHLTEIVIGEDVTNLPLMNNASNLKKVTLPQTLEALPDNIFSDCSALEEVNLSTSLQSIGANAFRNNYSLTALSLPESLKSIGYNAFSNCRLISEFDLADDINAIGDYAFSGCESLKNLHLPASLSYIAEGLFYNCQNLESVGMGDAVRGVGSQAFSNCPKLITVDIPEGVTSLRNNTFYGCSSLSEIKLPNTISTIAGYAFGMCQNLSKLELGTNLFEISDSAFEDCVNLAEIIVNAPVPPHAGTHTFPASIYGTATVTVPEQSLKLYAREDPWNRFISYRTMNNGVSLSHYEVEMAGDEVFQLAVYNNEGEVEWTTSNPEVAYVNECGLIVAMGQTGITEVTALVDGEPLNCRVLVPTPTRGEKIEMRSMRRISSVTDIEDIEPTEIRIKSISSDPTTVNFQLYPVGACTVMNWSSSDESIATIKNGLINIESDGDVEFTLETENGLSAILLYSNGGFTSGIEDVAVEADSTASYDVYDLTGRCLISNGTADQFKQLNKGLYIVNGKKVMVK